MSDGPSQPEEKARTSPRACGVSYEQLRWLESAKLHEEWESGENGAGEEGVEEARGADRLKESESVSGTPGRGTRKTHCGR